MFERYDGLQLDSAREQVREPSTTMRAVPKSAVQAQLEQVMESARRLDMSLSGDSDAQRQSHLLLLELETLESLLDEQE